MKLVCLIVAILLMPIASTAPVKAADFVAPSVNRSAVVVSTPGVRRPPLRVRVHRYAVVRKTIGMPCLLPPDVVVRLNWNGPQCRWVDNVIVPRIVRRHRVVRVIG